MKARISICIAFIITYCSLFNWYLYELFYRVLLTVGQCKLLYNYTSFGFLLFVLLDSKSGLQNYLHKQLNLWCVLLMLIHYIFIIAAYYGLKDPVTMLISFNLAVVISGVSLIISYLRTPTWKH